MKQPKKIFSKDGLPMLSARAAAARLNCAQDYIGKLCREGKLKGTQLNGAWFVEEASIAVFEAEREQARVQRSQELARERREEQKAYELATSSALGRVLIKARALAPQAFSLRSALPALLASALAGVLLAGGSALISSRAHEAPLGAALAQIDSPFFGTGAQVSVGNFGSAIGAWFAGLFSRPTVATSPAPLPVPAANAPIAAAPQFPEPNATTTLPAQPARSQPATIVQNTYPVRERVVERVVRESGVSQELLSSSLQQLGNQLRSELYTSLNNVSGPPASGGVVNNIALSQRIDKLDGVTITNSSISGYLPLSGGTLTGTVSITSTGTSTFAGGLAVTGGCVSVNGTCLGTGGGGAGNPGGSDTQVQFNDGGAFNGDAAFTFNKTAGRLTLTFASTTALSTAYASSTNLFAGTLTLGSALGVASGGTGLASSPSYGQILVGNASGGYTLTATSSLGIDSFGTTSANYWSSLGLGFSTTSANYWSSVNNFSGFSTTSADYYVTASSTIVKTNVANIFGNGVQTIPYASSTAISVSGTGYFGTASTSNLTISSLGGSAGQCLTVNSSGTVTAVNCGSAAGFAFTPTSNYGVLANATSTPLWFQNGFFASSTSQIAYASSTAISAVIGYFTTASTSNLTVSSVPLALLSTNAQGGVQSTGVSAPLSFVGGVLSITQSGLAQNGYLSSVDFNTFNNKIASTSLSATSPLTYNSSSGVFAFDFSTNNVWTGFNRFGNASTTQLSALDALYVGRTATTTIRGDGVASTLPYASSTAISVSGTGYFGTASTSNLIVSLLPSTILSTNGSGAAQATTIAAPLSFSGSTLSITQASRSTSGYLSSADFTTFDNKISSTSLSASYPLSYNASTGAFTTAFSTTTQNDFSAHNTFTSLFATNASTTNATTTTFAITGVPSCSLTQALVTNSSGSVSCGTITGTTFSFTPTTNYGATANSTSTPVWFTQGLQASSTSRFVDATFMSATTTYLGIGTLTGPLQAINGVVSATGTLSVVYGGTGTSTAPLYGQLLIGNGQGGFNYVATSSLGLSASDIATGTLAVQYGGTGVSSITGLVVGNGTAPFSSVTDSLGLKNVLSDETGSGALVFANSPTLAGLVGIGTSSPTSALGVHGNIYSSGNITGANVTATGTLTAANLLSTGSTTIAGILNAVGGGVLNITQATTSALAVTGSSTISGAFNALGGATFGAVTAGATTLSSLSVSGGSTLGSATSTGSLAVTGSTTIAGALNAVGAVTLGNATSSTFAITSVSSSLLKTLGGGAVVAAVAGTDYLTPGSLASAFPFTATTFGSTAANATSTLIGFTQGLYALASSTIGSGAQAGGLTISGGATTTGNAYIAGSLGIGIHAPTRNLDVAGTARVSATFTLSGTAACTGGQALQTNGSGDVVCGNITQSGASTGGGWTTDNIGSVTLATTTDRVGIGATTTPYAKLSILSGATATTTLALVAASGQTANILDVYGTNGTLQTVLTASGFLGLGTSSPAARLSVEGSSLLGNSATAGYFVATTTTASTLPYASSTALTATTGFFSTATTTALNVSGTATLQNLASALISTGASGALQSTTVSSPLSFSSNTLSLNVGSGLTTSGGNLILNMSSANNWVALQTFSGGATTTQLSALDALYVGRTATTTIRGDGVASTLPYASSTAISVSGTGYFGNLSSSASSTIAGAFNAVGGANLGAVTGSGLFTLAGGFYSTASSTASGALYSTLSNYLASTTLAGGTLFESATSSGSLSVTGSTTVAGAFNALGGANFGTARLSGTLTLTGTVSCTGQSALQTNSSGDVACGTVNLTGITSAGGWSTNNVGTVKLATSSDVAVVGATTTAPYAKLSVVGDAVGSTTLAIIPMSGQTNNIIDIYNTSGRLTSVLSAAGNLGLGTTSPYASLSVAGASGVVANQFYATSTAATSTFAGGFNVGNGALVYDYSGGYTSIQNLQLGALSFDTDAGQVSWVDMPVTSNATAGTVESYTAQLGGTPLLTVYGESSGSGGINNGRVGIGTTTPYARLTVWSDGSAGATTTLLIANSASTTLLSIKDDGTTYFKGNIGVGTTSPYAALSVVGQAVFSYVTATGTTASTLPYASSTALTATSLFFGSATSTGALAITGSTTVSGVLNASGASVLGGALTYGGVTLNNAVTGTGNMVLSASPTLTGTLTVPYASTTALTAANGAFFPGLGSWNASGNVGIGTSTYSAKLAIHAQAGETYINNLLFAVGSSTATATSTLFSIDNQGNVYSAGSYNVGSLSLNAPLAVSSGGTGVNSLTGIVIGNGTSPFTTVTDSLGLANNISDETGSGSLVFNTNPSLSGAQLNTASSTALSVLNALYVGRTATTTIRGDGVASTLPYASSTALTATSLFFDSATSTGALAITGSTTVSGALNVGGDATVGTLALTGTTPRATGLYLKSIGGITFNHLNSLVGGFTADTNYGNRLYMMRDTMLAWVSNTTDSDSAIDTAIKRTAAGQLEINNGTTGSYRDLILRSATTTGQTVLARDFGSVGIGTTSPAATLGVQGNGLFSGNLTAANITATGTLSVSGSASITGAATLSSTLGVTGLASFRNASSSLLSVTGTAYFGGTATTTIDSAGSVTVAGNFSGAGLSTCASGADKLIWTGGQFACGVDAGASGTEFNWAFFNGSGVRLGTTSNQVIIGATATSSGVVPLAAFNVVGGAGIDYATTTAFFSTTASSTRLFSSFIGVATSSLYGNTRLGIGGGNLLLAAGGDPVIASTTQTTRAFKVAVVGNIAYVADYGGGLRIVDVSNPRRPATLGSYGGISTAVSVVAAGRYAYVGDTATGISILDVSNPSSPTLVGSYSMGFPYTLALSGKYLYAPDYNAGTVSVIDVSDPRSPSLAGTYTIASGLPYGVALQGKYLYVADQGNSRIYIVDISNPAAPATVGSYSTINTPSGLYATGRYLYVADQGTGLFVLNVANPAAPTLVGTYHPNVSDNYYDVSVAGEYAYVADHNGKLIVLDVSSTSPRLVGSIATGVGNGLALQGKYAYLAGDTGGLSVIDINGAQLPAASIGALATNQLNVADDLVVGNNLYAGAGLDVGISGIFSRGAIAAFIASTTQTNPVVATFMGGSVGIGTTTPASRLSVHGNGLISGNLSLANLTATGTITASGLATFANGLISQASSTIGSGAQAGGLTISGGATTTGNSYTAGFVNTSGVTGGYQIDGNLILQASSTRFSVAVGSGALNSSFTNTQNTAVGYNALTAATSGGGNTAVGYTALTANTTGGNNTAVGSAALASNTTGNSNSAFGLFALNVSLSGSNNAAFGGNSLASSITGASNVAFGIGASQLNTSATNTVAVGFQAGRNTTGNATQGYTAVGYQAGFSFQTGGDYNTLFGYQAGRGITTGSNNIWIGAATSSAGIANLTTGSQNILIGNNISLPSATANGQLNIGNIIYGIGVTGTGSTVSDANIGIGTTSPTAKLSVQGAGLFSGDLTVANVIATGTLTASGLATFANGLISQASSTIGSGAQAGGLTISGGATTTGNAYVAGLGSFGSTSPFAKLSVHANNGDTNTTLFAIGSSTASATTTLFSVGNTGQTVINSDSAISSSAKVLDIQNAGSSKFNVTKAGNASVAAEITVNRTYNFGGSFLGNYYIDNFGGIYVYSNGQYTLQFGGTSQQEASFQSGGYLGWYPGNFFQGTSPDLRLYRAGAGVLSVGAGANNGLGTVLAHTLGLGTSTPYAQLSIVATSTTGIGAPTTLFAIASTTGGTSTTTLFSVSNTGFVGVGTTSPWAQFSINPTASNGAAPAFAVGSSTATSFVVDNAGKVGLGTTSPYAKLSISANSGETNRTLFTISSSTSATTTNFLSVSNTGLFSVGNDGSNLFTVDASSGTTTIANLALGNLAFETNAGVVFLSDIPVDSNAAAGVVQSQSIAIGGTPVLVAYGESDGAGSTQNLRAAVGTSTPYAKLTVWGDNTAAGSNSFLVANSASTTLFSIDNSGKTTLLYASSTALTATSLFATNASTTGSLYIGASTTVAGVLNAVGGLNAGALTASGLFSSQNASTSLLSVFNKAYFGATATSTFDDLGRLNLASTAALQQAGNTILFASSTNKITAVGDSALANFYNTNSTAGETAVGYQAMQNATSTAFNSTAVGYQALKGNASNYTGTLNTAVGYQALTAVTTGGSNTAVGYSALPALTTGGSNVGIGLGAGQILTTGTANVGVGAGTLYGYNGAVTGNYNVGVGYRAGFTISSGQNNVALGQYALGGYLFGTAITGSDNIGIGQNAATYLTTGSQNIGIGYYSLASLTVGTDNVGIGDSTLYRNITGIENTAIGKRSSYGNVSATTSVALGAYTAYGSGAGTAFNAQGYTALGYKAGYNFQTGSNYNTLLGYQAGYGITTGANNIILGADSGASGANSNLTTGSSNIQIGYNVSLPSATANNQLNIGNLLFGTNLDGSGKTYSSGQLGVGSTSPFARFSINLNNGDTNLTAFAIGSSTASATTTLFSVSNTGTVGVGTTTPGGTLGVAGSIFSSTGMNTSGVAGGYQINGATVLQASSSRSSLAVGIGALNTAYTGTNNVAIGGSALSSVTTGESNAAVGNSALQVNQTGSYNAALGLGALQLATADGNVGIGYFSGRSITSGSRNIALGYLTAWTGDLTTGSNNILIGSYVGTGSSTVNNMLNIGNVLYGSNLYSGSSITSAPSANGSIGIGTSTPFAKFAISLNNGDTIGGNNALLIASSTANATTTLFSVSNTGAVSIPGTLTVGSCVGCGGGSSFAWTPTTSFATAANSTSTLLLLANGLSASSTVRFGNAGVASQFQYSGSTGFLGLGTTTPWAQFSINPTASNGAAPAFAVGSSTATSFVVDNAGRVGLGTTSPYARLSISANNGDTVQWLFAISSSTNAGPGASSTLFAVSNTGNALFGLNNTGISFGNTYPAGSSGFGLRENGGMVEFRNAYASTTLLASNWTPVSSAASVRYQLNERSWTTMSGTLPAVLGQSQLVVVGDYMYLFGGVTTGSAYTNVIYRAPISNPTSWSNTGATLPGNLGLSQVAVIGDFIYLFGGWDGSNASNVIYRAPVSNPTAWVNTGATLTTPRFAAQAVVIDDYIYLLGGATTGLARINSIERAPVSNPTSWQTVSGTIPGLTYEARAAIAGDYVYLFGGYNGSVSNAAIYRAPLSNPTSWATTTGQLPAGNYGYQLATIGDYFYILGGVSSGQAVWRAPISDPTQWIDTGAQLPASISYTQTAVLGPNIYLFGTTASNGIWQATLTSSANFYRSWTQRQNAPSGPWFMATSSNANLSYLAGSVGIGTSSPYAQLSVFASPTASSSSNVLFAIGSTTASATTTLFSVSNTGFVGVGTTSPWAQFSINPTASNGAAPAFAVGSSTATSFVVDNAGKVGLGTTSPWAQFSINPTASNGAAPAFAIGSSTATRFVVDNAGRVGLGTTSPYARLSISANNGDTVLNLFTVSSSTSATTTSIFNISNAGLISAGQNLFTVDATTGSTTIANLSIGNINFDTNAGAVMLSDIPLDGTAATGTVQSQSIGINGVSLLTVYSEAMGTSTQNRRVGVASTTPWAQFSVHAAVASTSSQTLFAIGSTTAAGANSTLFAVSNTGAVGIGASTATTTLLNVGSASVSSIVASFTNGSGTCFINPTNTALSCSSDLRLKKDISSIAATTSLQNILALNPVFYNWNNEATSTPQHAGFIAQEVEQILPDLVQTDPNGYKSLNYAGLVPYLVSAVQEMSSSLLERVKIWLADSGNGILDLFATHIHAEVVYAKELCLEDVCITKTELQQLLNGSGSATGSGSGSGAATPQGDTSSDSAQDTESPTITLNGDNPASVAVGATYIDLGATVSDNTDQNLGFVVSLDNATSTTIDQLQLDTSVGGTHYIVFTAADQAGNTATATRTVIVGDGVASSTPPVDSGTATSTQQ